MPRARRLIDRLALLLAALFLADRAWKLAAVAAFLRRPAPELSRAPSVALIQPITRGASGLAGNLASRLAQSYPGQLRHILVCDAADEQSQRVAHKALADYPSAQAEIVVVPSPAATRHPLPHAGEGLKPPAQERVPATAGVGVGGEGHSPAPKIVKMQAALDRSDEEVLCFIDDDIALRPGSLAQLVAHLEQPGVGAAFGLACYVSWEALGSALMSIFVNANALTSYIPLTYLAEPYTITGHIFTMPRAVFERIGGLHGLGDHVGDDHALARRVRAAGLRNVQSQVIYDVRNELPTLRRYRAQMRRWFVFPRQAMLPFLTRRDRSVTALGSTGVALPPLLGLLALTGRRAPLAAFGATMLAIYASYAVCERHLGRRTPASRWPLIGLSALITPLEIAAALASAPIIEWRGRRIRVEVGGRVSGSPASRYPSG